MPSYTPHYGFGYFNFGDNLASDFSGRIEAHRWNLNDSQIYGLMALVGNGVIYGWDVTAETNFSVSISEGYGNINFISARTTFPVSIDNIPPNSINYIFVRLRADSTFSENVEFFISPTRNIADLNFLLLAQVNTGPLSVESIDNSIRTRITFIEVIREAIRRHRHRGGSQNPSKIDLSSEVKGQLPSYRIEDFDADKITSGTFDLNRLPLLSHENLINIGLLTHAQLDTFVKTLEANNTELFGEIGAANLLQLILGMKYIHDDNKSSFYFPDRTIDETMVNEFCIIPGITPNKHIDFDHTTAVVNLEDHYVQGVSPQVGTSFYVTYNTALSWKSAYSMDNVVVSGDTVVLAFNDDDESNILTIEGFESATSPGQTLSGESGGQELFKKQTIILTDSAHILANSSSTNVIEGFYSGKVTHKQSLRQQYVKEYTQTQDWSTYDSFVMHVKCLSQIHGPVKIYFEDDQNNRSIDFIVLGEDEVTSNSDPASNSFEMRVIDLSVIAFHNKIKKFVIFSDDLVNAFDFYLDFINVQRAILLPAEGNLKIRYSSRVNVTITSIDWLSTEPAGTAINVRARAANGTVFLTRSEYTPFLNNGSLINLQGTDLEIDIVFTPDTGRLSSPVLRQLRILILSEAEIDGFTINTETEFGRGDSTNAVINSSPPSISIDPPISVDSYYFCSANSVSQIHEEDADSNGFVNAELGLFGRNAPIAPNLIFQAIENGEETVNVSRFFEPRCVFRKHKKYLIADTYNDRVLQYDEDGNLLFGFGSINYTHGSKIFPISAAYDTRTSILYVVWSQKISFQTVNVSKITLKTITQQQIQLIRDFDKVLGLTTEELQGVDAQGQIMPIYLSKQNAALADTLPTTGAFLLASPEVTTGFDSDSIFYKAIATANGIPLFSGKFAYIDGIFTPTHAEVDDDGNCLVTNGTVAVKPYTFPNTEETITLAGDVSSIVEVNTNNQITFGANTLAFSPFIPGRASRIDKNTIMIGGIKPGGQEGTPEADAPFNFRSMSGNSDQKRTQKSALNKIFFGSNQPFVGAMSVIDTRTKTSLFEYHSPEGILVSDVDIDPTDGLYTLAESAFNQSGRIIKLDANGNIIFSYGEGLYSIISSIRTNIDGSLVIGT